MRREPRWTCWLTGAARGAAQRLFFAQIEAVETVVFLKEARSDFLQGIEVPREPVSDDTMERGFRGFERLACKMATGAARQPSWPCTADESHEVPRYERARESGSTADVDWWTSKDVRATTKSHVNYLVPDTKVWEQSAAFHIERHKKVVAWVKNAGLNFTIPYTHNGQDHDYFPDFIVRFEGNDVHLILETKGYDELMEVKRGAAERWVSAVNADGRHGRWRYGLALNPSDVVYLLDDAVR